MTLFYRFIPIEHPFFRIPPGKVRLFAVPIAVVAVVLALAIHQLVERGPGWPPFARLVLATTSVQASSVLSTWSPEDRDRIGAVARIDLLFGLLYSSLLALAVVWATRAAPRSPYRRLGSDCAWSSALIAVLDVPENLAYLAMTGGHTNQPWPAISASCVVVRTALFVMIVVFVAGALATARSDRAP